MIESLMREDHIREAKGWLNLTLFLVSLAFTEILFFNFSKEWYGILIWMILGAALEILKIFLLLTAKRSWKFGKKWQAAAEFFVYGLITLISVVASIAFITSSIAAVEREAKINAAPTQTILRQIAVYESTLTTVEKNLKDYEAQKVAIVESSSLTIKGLASKVDEADTNSRLNTLVAGIDKMGKSSNSVLASIEAQIVQLKAEQSAALINKGIEEAKLKALLASDHNVASNPFEDIGNWLGGISGAIILTYILNFMVFILEIAIFITTGEITEVNSNKYEEFKDIDKGALRKYIGALLDIPDNRVRLNNDDRIGEITGIDPDTCKKYRKLLLMASYRGVPLLETTRGCTKTRFKKEDMYNIAVVYLKFISSSPMEA
jgi:hypothetical protein